MSEPVKTVNDINVERIWESSKLVDFGDEAEIIDGYTDLVWYNGPLLSTGKNRKGDIILRILSAEDDDGYYYINSIISMETLLDFIGEKISAKEALEKATKTFLLLSLFEGADYKCHEVEISDFPDELLPTDDSFFAFDKNDLFPEPKEPGC